MGMALVLSALGQENVFGAGRLPRQSGRGALTRVLILTASHLQQRELDQVAAWVMANADLIQDYWDGAVLSGTELPGRIRRVPPLSRW